MITYLFRPALQTVVAVVVSVCVIQEQLPPISYASHASIPQL